MLTLFCEYLELLNWLNYGFNFWEFRSFLFSRLEILGNGCFCRCGPCQFMVSILNEVSTALKDKIQVVKIDTEKYPSIAGKYRIEALPTFIIFKDGKPFDRFVSLFSSSIFA